MGLAPSSGYWQVSEKQEALVKCVLRCFPVNWTQLHLWAFSLDLSRIHSRLDNFVSNCKGVVFSLEFVSDGAASLFL